MSMFMFAEPLLGTPETLKAKLSRSTTHECKAGGTLALVLLILGAMWHQHVSNETLRLEASSAPVQPHGPAIRGLAPTQNVTSAPTTQNIAGLVEEQPREAGASAVLLADSGDDNDKAAIEAFKEAKRDFTGIAGATTCLGAFLLDREASTACANTSPKLVGAVTLVLSLYVLFFFAPFYLFPEAWVAIGAWKIFPKLEEAIMVSAKDTPALEKMRMGLLITTVVAVFVRLFTLWNERNEKQAVGRQGSMLTSLVVAAVLYFILNFLTNES